MVDNSSSKRGPGRPREFDPDAALDRAIELFWADGFDGVDVERIAAAAGVTKPSLYRLFGDKSSIFLHALRRYGETIGAAPIAAFNGQPDLADAVAALLEETVKIATTQGRASGCLMACVAISEAGRSEEVRLAVAQGLGTLSDVLAARFDQEITTGRVSSSTSAETRSRMLVDLMQGLMLRARAGTSRSDLLRDAQNYVPVIVPPTVTP